MKQNKKQGRSNRPTLRVFFSNLHDFFEPHVEMHPVRVLGKLKAERRKPAAISVSDVAWSFAGSFLGISSVTFLQRLVLKSDNLFLIGSFGASAVLVYSAIKSPLAQPRNLIGGHFFSALVGVASYQLLGEAEWLAASVAVSGAIAVMLLTHTLHPPGGATALIAVIGGDGIHRLGYAYAFMPVAAGALVMLMIALVVNNVPKNRRYPEHWL